MIKHHPYLSIGASVLWLATAAVPAQAAAEDPVQAMKSKTPADMVPGDAGSHGFVQVDPETQRLVFEDGTPARFYGVNFATYLNEPNRKIPTEEMVKLLSDLKALGVNVIRAQVTDNQIQKGVFGKGLNKTAMENRDRFIAEGKKLGIYFHLCMSKPGSGKGGASELYSKAGGDREMMILVDELIEHQKTYTVNFLNHVNPYTGLAYKDEPAVIALQLGNEQHAYSRPGWQRWTQHTGPYAAEIKGRWNEFLVEKYGDRAGLAKAWGKGLKDGEDPAQGTVTIIDARYPTWKDNFTPTPKQQDIILFADAMQQRFHAIMRECIREEAGDTNHLISDNGWIRGNELIRQTAHEELDLLDLQHYWPHGARERLPVGEYYDVSPIGDCGINILSSMLTAREFEGVQKPAFITEYNSHKDNVWLPQFVPVHTVLAKLTGMDGLALWAYAESSSDIFFNKDHWFCLNRDESDIHRELMPFLVGSYLWRSSIPELVNQETMRKLAKWDDSNPEGLSVDYDASLQQATSVGVLDLPAEGVRIDFPGDSMLVDREDVIFFTGTGPFESTEFSYQPRTNDEPYLLAVFPVDGKPLAESRKWRVFLSLDGTMELTRDDFTEWDCVSREYANARGTNARGELDSTTWEISRPGNTLYTDLYAR
jgi:hypothetical protein